MPIKKMSVEEGDKKQDVIIAMTPEEANDRSYVEYLKESTEEKTKDQLRKKPPRETSKLSGKEKVDAIKDIREYGAKKQGRSVNPRYFSGNYTS